MSEKTSHQETKGCFPSVWLQQSTCARGDPGWMGPGRHQQLRSLLQWTGRCQPCSTIPWSGCEHETDDQRDDPDQASRQYPCKSKGTII